MSAPEYLVPAEVATLLRVSPRTVRRVLLDPTFPVLRLGRSVRVPRIRLESWLRRREQGAGRPLRSREPASGAPQVPAESSLGRNGTGACAEPCAETAGKAGQEPA